MSTWQPMDYAREKTTTLGSEGENVSAQREQRERICKGPGAGGDMKEAITGKREVDGVRDTKVLVL